MWPELLSLIIYTSTHLIFPYFHSCSSTSTCQSWDEDWLSRLLNPRTALDNVSNIRLRWRSSSRSHRTCLIIGLVPVAIKSYNLRTSISPVQLNICWTFLPRAIFSQLCFRHLRMVRTFVWTIALGLVRTCHSLPRVWDIFWVPQTSWSLNHDLHWRSSTCEHGNDEAQQVKRRA